MGFVTLLATLGIGILIATMITNMVRGIMLTISGLGILFYLFFATPDQRIMLDEYAKTINLSDTLAHPFQSDIYLKISELLKSYTS